MKLNVFTVTAFAILFAASHAVFAQKATAEATPKPTPEPIHLHVSVMELTTDSDLVIGNRQIRFDIELGKKSTDKALLAELKETGMPIKSVTAHNIVLRYPEAMDDCHILADAKKVGNIVIQYFPKHVLQFDEAFMKHFYPQLEKCEYTSSATLSP